MGEGRGQSRGQKTWQSLNSETRRLQHLGRQTGIIDNPELAEEKKSNLVSDLIQIYMKTRS